MNIALVSGLIILVCLVVLLLAGFPISIALGVSSVAAILPFIDLNAAFLTGAQRIFSGISSFSLLAIPFFILAGRIMNTGGIAIRLVNFAKLLTGRISGSLAHTNAIGNMLFGAISGSSVAACAAIGTVMAPLEEAEGYDKNFAAAVNISTAPTGLLIPPSNSLIIYSLVSGGTSVAALFMAGYIPGILWGLACMGVAFVIAAKKGYKAGHKNTVGEGFKIFLDAVPSLLLIFIVIGGILSGIFTATEGSVVAVVYSLILSMVFYRSIKFKELVIIFRESAEMTGIIVFLIGVSSIMSWVMAFTGVPNAIANALLSVSNNRIIILLIMNIVLLVVGTFMDLTPAILIFTPIFLPICQKFGMDSVHFGIMLVFNLCIGNITPPVGNTLFIGVKVAKTKLEDVIKPLLPFYAAIVIVLLLVSYIPALSLWLPKVMGV